MGAFKVGIRVNSAVHAIAILSSLRSQKMTNDFKVLFSLLCVSFGAGMRFINMLNHVGFTVSWSTAMNILDERMRKLRDNVQRLTPVDIAIILLMDNINIYRGKRRHLRIFRDIAPTMWNFTRRALIIPHLSCEVKTLLTKKERSVESQRDPLKLNVGDVIYCKERNQDELFENVRDNYILNAMDTIYNQIAETKKDIKEMNETEINKWLADGDFEKTKRKFKIKYEDSQALLNCSTQRTNVFVLPLSLEDNSTIAETASLLDDFAFEFHLPSAKTKPELLVFDNVKKTFDIQLARTRFEYLNMCYRHQSYMADLEQKLNSKEKRIDGMTTNELLEMEEDISIGGEVGDETDEIMQDNVSTTLESQKRQYQKEDEPFWKMHSHLVSLLNNAIHSNSTERYLAVIKEISKTDAQNFKDHLQRNLLHVAVEKDQNQLVKCLVYSGFSVNTKEGCGLTALHLAVLNSNTTLVSFLIENNAKYDGPLFSGIPSPKDVATKLNLQNIVNMMTSKESESDDENELIRTIDQTMKQQHHNGSAVAESQDTQEITRSSSGYVTHVIGDVGTCKTNQAVIARSCTYDWVGTVIEDLHNKGYFVEAFFKEHGQSGFHYIVTEVLKRKKLTAEAFKAKKFQDNNLSQIREALRDCCHGYCMSACLQFRQSHFFPSYGELANCLRQTGSHSGILLSKFKD